MWSFLKRQWNTKTGKAAIAVIAGAAASSIPGVQEHAPGVVDAIDAVANGQSVTMAVLAMFLRDKQAKEDEKRRGVK